ncbi:MAG: YkgJ family cysteine cluster protein [Treponema sp.]|nr:YkgJ family cysteine cluster protein [Treponema sp.]
MKIFDKIQGTLEWEIIQNLADIYKNIDIQQEDWKKQSGFHCTTSCDGKCCVGFEPHINECEALFLAANLLENNEQMAKEIIDGTFIPQRKNEETCIFFNESGKYHCRVYEGRCLICRLFGYCGDYGKNGEIRWKPCKFYPNNELKKMNLEHKQYLQDELKNKYNALPPVMNNFSQQTVEISPDTAKYTEPIRIALPKALKRLMFLSQF